MTRKKSDTPIGYGLGEIHGKIIYHVFNMPTFKRLYREIKGKKNK